MTHPDPDRQVVRPPWFWVSVAAAALGLILLGFRLLTLPQDGVVPVAVGVVLALLVTAAVFAGMVLRIRSRVRAAAAAFPDAVLVPVVLGTATSVATRWFAQQTGDSALRLAASGYATIAIDAAGLHVVSSPAPPYGHLPAEQIGLGGLGRTLIGMRETDALILEVALAGHTAPLALVPMRIRGNPLRFLTDAELFEVTGRIEAALAGRPARSGWGY